MLALDASDQTKKFDRYVIVKPMIYSLIAMIPLISLANQEYDQSKRLRYLRYLKVAFELFYALSRVCRERGLYKPHVNMKLVLSADELIKQINGWIKNTESRLKG